MMAETFIEIGFIQHCGKQSKVQQDAMWNGEFLCQVKQCNAGKRFRDGTDAVMLAVADGVSASPMPHLASAFVVAAIGARPPEMGITAKTIREIHAQLSERYGRDPTKDTATTIVAACLRNGTCEVVNVGDSRAYRIGGDGGWQQLSHDHSYLNADGHLDETQEDGPIYDQLMDYVMANSEEDSFSIRSKQTPFLLGDSLLLCSGGLHEVLTVDTLKQLYKPNFPPGAQVDIWLRAVLDAGAPDNVSILLARLKPRGHRHSHYEEFRNLA